MRTRRAGLPPRKSDSREPRLYSWVVAGKLCVPADQFLYSKTLCCSQLFSCQAETEVDRHRALLAAVNRANSLAKASRRDCALVKPSPPVLARAAERQAWVM